LYFALYIMQKKKKKKKTKCSAYFFWFGSKNAICVTMGF
jgi:hypothetical protein